MQRHTRFLSLILFMLLIFPALGAQEPKQSPQEFQVNMDEFIQETQQSVRGNDYAGLVWWVPAEFWEISAKAQGQGTTSDQFNPLRDYTMVVIAVGKVSGLAGITWVPRTELQTNVFLRDSEGMEFHPLEKAPSEVSMIPILFNAMFSKMLGEMGENLQTFFFPSKNRNGNLLADASSKGSFSVVLRDIAGPGDSIYEWKLPLASLSPSRLCPVGGEQLKANWNYCPWHGNALDMPQ